MTTIAEEITRVQLVLQDIDVTAPNIVKVTQSLTEAAQELARLRYFPQMIWIQAVSGTALYTMPTTNVTIEHIIYNERVLRYMSEDAFDRKQAGWEALSGEPHYWTKDNLARNTFRVIPSPTRTGGVTSYVPPAALASLLVDNLLIFATEDVSASLSAVVMPTLLDYDDWMVFYAVALHAQKETTQQNQPLAKNAAMLAAMWLGFLERDKDGGTA